MTTSASVRAEAFGHTPDGRSAEIYTLQNPQLRVRITNYGGRIVTMELPDTLGRWTDVLLGFDDVSEYAKAGGAFGALLGRTANRIAGGQFSIDEQTYRLATNEGTSTLHGGTLGFDKLHWTVLSATGGPEPTLILVHNSPDGDQGFPGELSVRATYRLRGDLLWLEFEARTTRPTLVSLSAHPYFNLGPTPRGSVLDHEVSIASDTFLPTDAKQIPTGEFRAVDDTAFDFRRPRSLRAGIRTPDTQLIYGKGYDHYFVLRGGAAEAPSLAARAHDPVTGRTLEIYTTQPGLQLYSGNQLNGSIVGRDGAFRQSAGLAFEPQGFPDAPHHPRFPSTVLRPEEVYSAVIGYRLMPTASEALADRT